MIVYVDGNYVGHFRDDAELGRYFGLYAGVTAGFNVRLPELYEVPENSLVDPDMSMMDAIKKTVGHRHIKGVFRHNGKLLVSKFQQHDAGPAYKDQITDSSLALSDQFVNVAEVQGADPYCIYAHEPTLDEGRHYALVNQPNLMTVEHCYEEARHVVKSSMEQRRMLSLGAPIDLRVEPEDEIATTVEEHGIDDESFYVDDISTEFNLEKRNASQVVSTRQRYDLE